jgi:nucleosome binding factor SPN SPT16 subunit
MYTKQTRNDTRKEDDDDDIDKKRKEYQKQTNKQRTRGSTKMRPQGAPTSWCEVEERGKRATIGESHFRISQLVEERVCARLQWRVPRGGIVLQEFGEEVDGFGWCQ